jgi:hypothetical protein
MIPDMAALEANASLWDSVSAWSALAVFFGVAAECVADFKTLARWFRLKTDRSVSIVAKSGLLLLTAALAVEVVAAIESHNTNEAIIGKLNDELNSTLKLATNLANLTNALGLSNKALQQQVHDQSALLGQTGGSLTTLAKQSAGFEKAIRSQEARNNADLTSLKSDAEKVASARQEILSDAAKTADAVAAVNKAQTDMTTALNTVQTMRQRLQEIITPRQIDDAKFVALVAAMKEFPKTPVEVAMTRDPECSDLMIRITDAMTNAGWTIQPFSGGGLPLTVNLRPNLPTIGEVTGRGVQLNISESDRERFSKPLLAVANVLRDAGVQAFPQAFRDKTEDGKPDPIAVKSGVIHVVIGLKP